MVSDVAVATPASTAVPAAKAATATPAQDDSGKPDRTSAMTTAHITGKRVEDLSQRTDTTKTYANPDGSWTTEDWAEPVQTQDDQGDWHDIDTNLVETPDGIEPKYVPSDLVLSDGSADQPLAQVTNGDKNVSLDWPTDLPKPVLDGNTATYKDVKPGQDLVVTASNIGFEYSLVLNQKPDPADGPVVLNTPIDTDGAKLAETPAGGAVITDGKDTIVTSPQPIMYDASTDAQGEPTSAVALDTDVTKDADGDPQLSVAADQAFLDSPTTEYPVTIDPTVVSAYDAGGDAFVETPSPLSGNQNDPQLRVGTYDGGTHKARSYIRFDSQPWSGSHILSAQLVLLNSSTASCSGNDIQASQITSGWSPSTVSWANQPSAGANPAEFIPAYGAAGCPANYARWDVTSIVNSWNSGGPNAGIRIQAINGTVNASWRVYYSDNAGAPASAPHLNVTYNNPPSTPGVPGISPAQTYTPPNGQGVLYTRSATPTLAANVNDPNGDATTTVLSVYSTGNGAQVGTCTTGSTASNSTASCTLGSALADGGSYYATAQTYDGVDWGPVSAARSFSVATGQPPAPTVGCGEWTNSPPTSDVTCTLSAASSSAAAAGWIHYTLDGGADHRVAITQSADPNVAKTAFTIPNGEGGDAVVATAESPAGVFSDGRTENTDDGTGDPGDPPPTSYGVDGNELADLQRMANQDGTSLQSAVDNYGWQDAFAADVATISAAHPDLFSYAQIDSAGTTTSASVGFTTAIPSDAQSTFSNLPKTVTLSQGGQYTDSDMRQMTADAAQSLSDQLGSGASFEVEFNRPQSEIDATVTDSSTTSNSKSIQRSTQASVAASNTNSPPPVKVFYSNVAPTTTTLQGGARIGRTSGSTSYSCTSGFPGRNPSSGQYGIITAAHCGNMTQYATASDFTGGRSVLQSPSQKVTAKYGDLEFIPSSGEGIGKSFYYLVGKERKIEAVKYPVPGMRLCTFGRTSDGHTTNGAATCATVLANYTSVQYKNEPGNPLYHNMTETTPDVVRPGDSGGPWFSGSTAYGINSGHGTDRFGQTIGWFAPVAGIGSINVIVNK